MADQKDEEISNAEMRKILERALVRFQNWRVEVERDPNPRLVHQLKNLVSIIDSISSINEERMKYSYKQLSQRMAVLVNDTAQLNMRITTSLADDDTLDGSEEKEITAALVALVQSAVALIGMVQENFGSGRRSPVTLTLGVEPSPVVGAIEDKSSKNS